MKSYKIIEEGRLNKSEMAHIAGGGYSCTGTQKYHTEPCDGGSYSSCMGTYKSCTDSGKMSCSKYEGPTGPGGILTPILPPLNPPNVCTSIYSTIGVPIIREPMK